jgi:hypothetical protein
MHPTIELVTIPAARPLILRSGGKPHPTSKLGWMKRYTTKLRSESSFRPFKMNLFVLIVQLIVMGENICSRMTSVRSNNSDKLANLNDTIRCQLMQLRLKLAQNVQRTVCGGIQRPTMKKSSNTTALFS